jgi:hypothetical protein
MKKNIKNPEKIQGAVELGKAFKREEKLNGVTEASIVLYKAFCQTMDSLEYEDREVIKKKLNEKP